MRKPKTLLLLAVVGLLLVIAGYITWSNRPAPTKPPLSIGLVTWIGYAPVYVAQAKGFFRDEKIDVRVHVMDSPGQREAAFASGAINLFPNSPDAFSILSASGQARGPIVMALDRSVGGDGVVAKASIRSWLDLSGKAVGYQKGITSHFMFLWLLKEHGVSEKSVRQVSLDAGQAGAAFVAGKLDAAVTWEPWLSKAAQSPGSHALATSADTPYLLADVLMVDRSVAASRSEDLKGFMRAWYRAVEYIHQNPDEASKILGKSLGVPPAEIPAMLGTIRFFSPQEGLAYLEGATSDRSVRGIFATASTLYKQSGVIPSTANPKLDVDTRVLREAVSGRVN